MTTGEFIAAAVIAIYAMLGSALLSAAVAHPANCLRTLDLLTPGVWLFTGVVIFPAGILGIALPWRYAEPILWYSDKVVMAHIALLALFALTRWIAQYVQRGLEAQKPGGR